MAFDVEGARKAGYTDKEIAQHLAESNKFDYDGAVGAGYTDSDIIGHLAKGSLGDAESRGSVRDSGVGASEEQDVGVAGKVVSILTAPHRYMLGGGPLGPIIEDLVSKLPERWGGGYEELLPGPRGTNYARHPVRAATQEFARTHGADLSKTGVAVGPRALAELPVGMAKFPGQMAVGVGENLAGFLGERATGPGGLPLTPSATEIAGEFVGPYTEAIRTRSLDPIIQHAMEDPVQALIDISIVTGVLKGGIKAEKAGRIRHKAGREWGKVIEEAGKPVKKGADGKPVGEAPKPPDLSSLENILVDAGVPVEQVGRARELMDGGPAFKRHGGVEGAVKADVDSRLVKVYPKPPRPSEMAPGEVVTPKAPRRPEVLKRSPGGRLTTETGKVVAPPGLTPYPTEASKTLGAAGELIRGVKGEVKAPAKKELIPGVPDELIPKPKVMPKLPPKVEPTVAFEKGKPTAKEVAATDIGDVTFKSVGEAREWGVRAAKGQISGVKIDLAEKGMKEKIRGLRKEAEAKTDVGLSVQREWWDAALEAFQGEVGKGKKAVELAKKVKGKREAKEAAASESEKAASEVEKLTKRVKKQVEMLEGVKKRRGKKGVKGEKGEIVFFKRTKTERKFDKATERLMREVKSEDWYGIEDTKLKGAVVSSVREKLGITKDPEKGSWILENGEMVNRPEGGHHRVWDYAPPVRELKDGTYELETGGRKWAGTNPKFMASTGAVRLVILPKEGIVNLEIAGPPTMAQVNTIRRMAKGREVMVDVADMGSFPGERAGWDTFRDHLASFSITPFNQETFVRTVNEALLASKAAERLVGERAKTGIKGKVAEKLGEEKGTITFHRKSPVERKMLEAQRRVIESERARELLDRVRETSKRSVAPINTGFILPDGYPVNVQIARRRGAEPDYWMSHDEVLFDAYRKRGEKTWEGAMGFKTKTPEGWSEQGPSDGFATNTGTMRVVPLKDHIHVEIFYPPTDAQLRYLPKLGVDNSVTVDFMDHNGNPVATQNLERLQPGLIRAAAEQVYGKEIKGKKGERGAITIHRRTSTEKKFQAAMKNLRKAVAEEEAARDAKVIIRNGAGLKPETKAIVDEIMGESEPKVAVAKRNKSLEQEFWVAEENSPLSEATMAYNKTGDFQQYLDGMPTLGELKPGDVRGIEGVVDVRESGHFVHTDFARQFVEVGEKPEKGPRPVSVKAKDIPTNWHQTLDPGRLIEWGDEKFGGQLAKKLLRPARDAIRARLAYEYQWDQALVDMMKKHGVRSVKDRKALGHFMLGEKGRYGENIKAMAADLTAMYGEILGQMNGARTKRSQPLIPAREDFGMPWMVEQTWRQRLFGSQAKPEGIIQQAPPPDYIRPNHPFNPRELKRRAEYDRYVKEKDAVKVMGDYIRTAAKDIFHTDVIHNNKVHAKFLSDIGLPNLSNAILDWTTGVFAGRAHGFDRLVESLGPVVRGAARFQRKLKALKMRTIFPLNLPWNFTVQTTSTTMLLPRVGVTNAVKGMRVFVDPRMRRFVEQTYTHTMKSKANPEVAAFKETVAEFRDLDRRGVGEKYTDKLNFVTKWMEKWLTDHAVASGYYEGLRRGLKGRDLLEFASDVGARVHSMYNFEDLPAFLRSKDIKASFPLQTFAFEAVNNLRELSAGKGAYAGMGKANRGARMLKWVAGIWAANALMESLTGRKPWTMVSFIPFGAPILSLFGFEVAGGRYDSYQPMIVQFVRDVQRAASNAVLYDDWTATRQLLTSWWAIGGTQIERAAATQEAVEQGRKVKSATGQTIYKIPKEEVGKAYILGPGATSEGQKRKAGKERLVIENILGRTIPKEGVKSKRMRKMRKEKEKAAKERR